MADTFKSTSTPSATGPASSSGSRLAEWLRVHGTIRGGKGSATATAASQNALANSNTLQNESLNSYNALMPELQTMAAHPPGTAPADLAAQSTEAMQGAGGSQGAAVGQGALLEGRTKNPGSARAAIASSSRGAGEELGRRGLQIRTNDAALKAKQQQEFDAAATKALLEFIAKLQQERAPTILLVTHDLTLVRKHAQQVIWLYQGRVLHGPVAELLTPERLAEIFETEIP